MSYKTTSFFRQDLTPTELLKQIRVHLLEAQPPRGGSVHQVNADSNDVVVAMKAINEKLTQHIEGMCARPMPRESRDDRSRGPSKEIGDSQKLNAEKMTTALQNQLSYYEGELKRLEEYRTRITKKNYLGALNEQTSALKQANAQLSKEVNDARLRLNGLVSKEGKERADKATKMQDLMLKIKYYEEKIAKLEANPEAKDTFLKKIQDDDRKVQEKIDKLRQEHGKVISDQEYTQRKKAAELRSKLDRLRVHNAHLAETAKKQSAVLQFEIEKLRADSTRLSKEAEEKARAMEAQAEKVRAEEQRAGQTITDVKQFIFKERRNQHSRDLLREQSEKKDSRFAKLNQTTLPAIASKSVPKRKEAEAKN